MKKIFSLLLCAALLIPGEAFAAYVFNPFTKKLDATGGTATPSGSDKDVQINNSGALGSDSGYLTHDSATHTTSTPNLNITNGDERYYGTTYGAFIDFNDAGVLGSMRTGGAGNTNNEALDWDYETNSNVVGLSSPTGVTRINFGSIGVRAVHYSSDNTVGFTGSCGAATTATVKDGLITACA